MAEMSRSSGMPKGFVEATVLFLFGWGDRTQRDPTSQCALGAAGSVRGTQGKAWTGVVPSMIGLDMLGRDESGCGCGSPHSVSNAPVQGPSQGPPKTARHGCGGPARPRS